MIDLTGRFPAEPEHFQERTKRAREKVTAAVDYQAGNFPASKEFGALWSEFKHILAEAQHQGKCVYCETRIRAGYPGDVEHFRPKAEVCEPIGRGNRIDTTGDPRNRQWETERRPGYWWLAYDWSNYVFSCFNCNGWKSNSFPLQGGRAATSVLNVGDELFESAMLLNPYLEDPTDHLTWDERGQISFLTEKGELTIDRCGLDRESLRLDRDLVAKEIQVLVDDLGSGDLTPELAIKYLLGFCRAERPYAGMARVLVASKLGLATDEVVQLVAVRP